MRTCNITTFAHSFQPQLPQSPRCAQNTPACTAGRAEWPQAMLHASPSCLECALAAPLAACLPGALPSAIPRSSTFNTSTFHAPTPHPDANATDTTLHCICLSCGIGQVPRSLGARERCKLRASPRATGPPRWRINRAPYAVPLAAISYSHSQPMRHRSHKMQVPSSPHTTCSPSSMPRQ